MRGITPHTPWYAGFGLALGPQGAPHILNLLEGTQTFDGQTLTSKNPLDLLLAKFSP